MDKIDYKIGDEVIRHWGDESRGGDDKPTIVVGIDTENQYLQCLDYKFGKALIHQYPLEQYRKTGKTYPELAKALEQISNS